MKENLISMVLYPLVYVRACVLYRWTTNMQKWNNHKANDKLLQADDLFTFYKVHELMSKRKIQRVKWKKDCKKYTLYQCPELLSAY
jgi:hypothetical protein